jgi:serine/threonine protein kinase
MTAPSHALQAPRFLGRYELMYLLGQGGMGEVHLARLTGAAGFEKLCIVKTILPQMNADPQFVDRFHHEAKVLVQLNHSNIAQVYDMGDVDQTLYMAIEYVAGVDLSRVVDRARAMGSEVPVPVALLIGQQMCEALGYAHRKVGGDGAPLGIVHRDISPQNVMVSYEGEVKVIDFGLAKSSARSKHTLPSTVLGKLGYMSPEQARADKVDHRSDIYSAGIVIWELLAGRPLIQAGTVGEMVAMMAHPRVPSLREIRPEVSEAVEKLVMRALQSDASGRYSRADDLARAINEQLVRESLSVSSEDVGNYVRAMCPEEFAAERQLQSRLSMMRKKGGSSPDQRPQLEGTLVRAPASSMAAGMGATQLRTPTPQGNGSGGAPLTAAQKAISTMYVDPHQPQGATEPMQPAYVPAGKPGSNVQLSPSVELVVPKSRAPLVIVLLLLLGMLGGGGFFAYTKFGPQLLGTGTAEPLVEPLPEKKEPEKLIAAKAGDPPKKEEAVKEEPKKEEAVAAKPPEDPPQKLERIEVKGPVMKVIRDGEHFYVQVTGGKVRLQPGDQIKLLSEPVEKNKRDVVGIADVVESKGALARILLDPDTKLPAHAFAIKDEGPKRIPKPPEKPAARKDEPRAEPKKEEVLAKAEPPGPAPTTAAKEEPKREEPKPEPKKEEPKQEAKKEEPKQEAKKDEPKQTAAAVPANTKILTGGIVLGAGIMRRVHIYNRSDFDWHGCELRLPNRTFYRYNPQDEIKAGESDGIAFTKFQDDTRPEDPQAAHGWALVRCKEGAGYLQFKTN